jgi:hypothetical protein
MTGIFPDYSHQFFEPRPEPILPSFSSQPGTLYAALDENFSIFKGLVDRSVVYREKLNQYDSRVTLLAFPDSSVPVEIRPALRRFSRAEATELIGVHLLFGVKTLQELNGYLLPTHNRARRVYIKDGSVSVPQTRPHSFQLLNKGDLFANGVVLVIDGVLTP